MEGTAHGEREKGERRRKTKDKAASDVVSALGRALDKVVAQVSNLLYRRFPIGKASESLSALKMWSVRRLEALRYSRLETCATTGMCLALMSMGVEHKSVGQQISN